MRFARLRELAESPLLVLPSASSADALIAIGNELHRREWQGGDGSTSFSLPVGPELRLPGRMPDQVVMNLLASKSGAHSGTLEALEWGRGTNLESIERLIANPEAGSSVVDFHWKQGGYSEPRKNSDKAQALAALNFDYRQALQESILELINRSNMQPGDVINNRPLGMGEGDYRRALAYSKYAGFGPVNMYSEQSAVIGQGMKLEPMLQGAPSTMFAQSRGWAKPQTEAMPAELADRIVSELRTKLGIKDDASLRPVQAASGKRAAAQAAASDRYPGANAERRQWDREYRPQLDDFDDYDFDDGEVDFNPYEEFQQLGIPGVAPDLSYWSSRNLVNAQREEQMLNSGNYVRLRAGIVPREDADAMRRRLYESSQYDRGAPVLPGMEMIVDEAYEIPF